MALYTREDLIDAWVACKRPEHRDLATWNARRLAALEQAFGLRLDDPDGARERSLWLLFDAAADSAAAITSPWAGFLEASLVTRRLAEAGVAGRRVEALAGDLDQLARRSREGHRRMLSELFGLLWDVGGTVTSDDLRGHGFDDVAPRPTR